VPPFALASVDGGESYWHPRDSGEDAAAMLDEFVPLLACHGLDVRPLGFLGRSMGGFGEGDPFCLASRDFVHGFTTRPAGGFEPGNHDVGYWRRIAPHQLRSLGRALASAT
jgi:hypothetical protein